MGFWRFGHFWEKWSKRGPKMGPKSGPLKKSEKMAKQTRSTGSRGSTHLGQVGTPLKTPICPIFPCILVKKGVKNHPFLVVFGPLFGPLFGGMLRYWSVLIILRLNWGYVKIIKYGIWPGVAKRWSEVGQKGSHPFWPGVQISRPPVKNRFLTWFWWFLHVLAFWGGPKIDPFLIDFGPLWGAFWGLGRACWD